MIDPKAKPRLSMVRRFLIVWFQMSSEQRYGIIWGGWLAITLLIGGSILWGTTGQFFLRFLLLSIGWTILLCVLDAIGDRLRWDNRND